MNTKKLFVGIVILNVVLMTVGVGYSTAGNQRTTLIASVASTQPRLNREIVISSEDNLKYRPDIAYNSKHDEYLVVWENVWGGDYHDIYAQRISSTGQLLSWFAVYTGTNKKMQPSVAYDPTHDRYLVTWIYDVVGDGSNWDVYGRFIPWSGPDANLVDFSICNWSSGQWHPKVAYAYTQDEFLVVWMNAAPSVPTYISGRRVMANGSGFPANGFLISSGAENRDFPAVAYNLARNEYLVTWDVDMAGLDIYGVRLSGSGSVLGGGEIAIAGWPDDEEHPAVAACNLADQYFVAWQSLVNPATNDYAIYGRYIDGDGTLADPYVVDDTTAPEKEPDVACSQGGQRYFIAWQTMYTDGYYGVWGRVAYPDESMDDQFGLVASGNAADRTFPAVAGGTVSYLTAWEHERDGTSYQDIHGRLVMLNDLFLPIVKK
jgi:hypothetical protein